MLKSKNKLFIAAEILIILAGFMLAFNGEFILSSAVLGFSVLFSQTDSQQDSKTS